MARMLPIRFWLPLLIVAGTLVVAPQSVSYTHLTLPTKRIV